MDASQIFWLVVFVLVGPAVVFAWGDIIHMLFTARKNRQEKLAELQRHAQHCCEAGPDACPNIKEEVA